MSAPSFADRMLEAGLYPRNVLHQLGLGFADISDDDPSPLFAGVTHKVALLFTSRSGTTFVADMLNRSGSLGTIAEHLNRPAIRRGERSWGVTSMREYVGESVRRHTSRNGVYAFKGSAEALLPLVQVNELPRHVRDWSWISVRRRDVVAQAVSLHRAKATRVWHDSGAPGGSPPVADFDFDGVQRELQSILQRQAQNERFFALHRVEPLRLVYEDVRDDPARAIVAIFEHVGIAPPPDVPGLVSGARFRILQNPQTQSHIERFRAELEARLREPDPGATR